MEFCDRKCCFGPEKCLENGEFEINESNYHKVCRVHLSDISKSLFIQCGYCNSVCLILKSYSLDEIPNANPTYETTTSDKTFDKQFCYKCSRYVDNLYESKNNENVCLDCFNKNEISISNACENCQDQTKELYKTDCCRRLCDICYFTCCTKFCVKCRKHFQDDTFLDQSQMRYCSECYEKSGYKVCAKCQKNIQLYTSDCGQELCEECFNSCCDRICQKCFKHSNDVFHLTSCNKRLCNQCHEFLCHECKSLSENKLSKTGCNKILCEKCKVNCCNNLCRKCLKHSSSELKPSECNKLLCEDCSKNCCDKRCGSCENHSDLDLIITGCKNKMCKKCTSNCCERLCNSCNIHSNYKLEKNECNKRLCESCKANCCDRLCSKCFCHLNIFDSVNVSIEKLCESCKPDLPLIEEFKQCPSCLNPRTRPFKGECYHTICEDCRDQCRECNKQRRICIHCKSSDSNTYLYDCDYKDTCFSCVLCIQKHVNCINCGKAPIRNIRFKCFHPVCENCKEDNCKVCTINNERKCLECGENKKLFKRERNGINDGVVCLHSRCFECIQKSNNCNECLKSSNQNKEKRSKVLICESCKVEKIILDINQDCTHKICSDCVNSCRLCMRICQGCNNLTSYKFLCTNKHSVCRSCSNNKKKCELCLSDGTYLFNCLKCNEITYHWNQKEVYVCILCKNQETFENVRRN